MYNVLLITNNISFFFYSKIHSVFLSIHDSGVTNQYGGEFVWDSNSKQFKKNGKVLQMQGTHTGNHC